MGAGLLARIDPPSRRSAGFYNYLDGDGIWRSALPHLYSPWPSRFDSREHLGDPSAGITALPTFEGLCGQLRRQRARFALCQRSCSHALSGRRSTRICVRRRRHRVGCAALNPKSAANGGSSWQRSAMESVTERCVAIYREKGLEAVNTYLKAAFAGGPRALSA
jgi:hypothetical protein